MQAMHHPRLKLSTRRFSALKSLVCVGCTIPFVDAFADSYRKFQVSGTLDDGTQLTGTIDLDINGGYFTHPSIKVRVPGASLILNNETYNGGYGAGGSEIAIANQENNALLQLFLTIDAPYPTNYTQGSIVTPSAPSPPSENLSNSSLQYKKTDGSYITTNLTSGYLYAEPKTCSDTISGNAVTEMVSGINIYGYFTPNGGLTLQQAAAACNVQGFDWQQVITHLPAPSPVASNNKSNKPLTAPPNIYDPPLSGWSYWPGYDPFPFYYRAQNDYTGYYAMGNVSANEPTPSSLTFFDSPKDSSLPANGILCYTTSLVGVLPGYTATAPLTTFYWTSTNTGSQGSVLLQACPVK